jgi:hypothetical protein
MTDVEYERLAQMKSLMSSFRLMYSAGTVVIAALVAGCSSGGGGTNRTMEFANPNISVVASQAEVEVGEQVSGEGCSNEYLSFFNTGDSNFLGGQITSKSSPEDRAKAAAAYNALTQGRGLTTDILVQPVWQVSHKKLIFGWLSESTCAKVVGYRGVIKGFKKVEK